MGSKTRLSSYCTKRGDNTVNLVTSRKTNTRLARPISVPMRYLELNSKNNFMSTIPTISKRIIDLKLIH